MNNLTLLQYFEWYLPNNHLLWRRAATEAGQLAKLGFDGVWLPPAFKGQDDQNVGYGVYDLYDLGEFDQKGFIPTKYGTRNEYLAAIKALQKHGIKVFADIVLNSRIGGDETEVVRAIEQDGENRLQQIGQVQEIEAWTKYTFPGRNGKYSSFTWNSAYFNGIDYDERTKKSSIYLFEGKQWDSKVAKEKANYDYLLGADVDLHNPKVREEMLRWGEWYVATTGVDGFRLDATKHIGSDFYSWWLTSLRQKTDLELPTVGEYWSNDMGELGKYLQKTGNQFWLFDVPLHFNFFKASRSGDQFPMNKLLDGTLIQSFPDRAVTFVDNHDTQPSQGLDSWVDGWFKTMAYAVILLRGEGTPCVFWGDLYGIPHDKINAVPDLKLLLQIRKHFASGALHDYFDHEHIVGFTREGSDAKPNSSLAVIMSNSKGGQKEMNLGQQNAGKKYIDIIYAKNPPVILDNDANGVFNVGNGTASIYVEEKAAKKLFLSGYSSI
jgi:alpha-amylase